MKTFLEWLLEYTDPQVVGSRAISRMYQFLNLAIRKSNGLFVDEDRERYETLLAGFRGDDEGQWSREGDVDVLAFEIGHSIEGSTVRDGVKWSKSGRTKEAFHVDARGVFRVMKTSGQKRVVTRVKWERPHDAVAVSKSDMDFSISKGDVVSREVEFVGTTPPTKYGGQGLKFKLVGSDEDLIVWSYRGGLGAEPGDILDADFFVKDIGIYQGRKSVTGDKLVIRRNKTKEERDDGYKLVLNRFNELFEKSDKEAQNFLVKMATRAGVLRDAGIAVREWPRIEKEFENWLAART